MEGAIEMTFGYKQKCIFQRSHCTFQWKFLRKTTNQTFLRTPPPHHLGLASVACNRIPQITEPKVVRVKKEKCKVHFCVQVEGSCMQLSGVMGSCHLETQVVFTKMAAQAPVIPSTLSWRERGMVKEGRVLFLWEPILEVTQDSSTYIPLAGRLGHVVASVKLRSVICILDGGFSD